jgi:hypothetical protein
MVIILIIFSINIAAIVLMKDCPLDIFEKKYLPDSFLSNWKWMIQDILPTYKCEYINIVEYLLNGVMIVLLKCLALMIWQICRPFQLVNPGNLYA